MRTANLESGRVQAADLMEDFFGSAEALEASQRELQRRLEERGIYFGDGLLPTYVYASVSNADEIGRWGAKAERLVEAAERASKQLFADMELCASLGIERDALELIRVDPGYQRTCVLCRPDGIPVGGDMKFVELNSDSPAMMMFIDVVAECMLELEAFASLRGAVVAPRATNQLLEVLLECYRDFGGTDVPTIAITDWDGQKTRFEHQRLAEHFENQGYPTVVCDPRSFRGVDGKLYLKERRIDLVYRRALSAEIIERRDEVEPLLSAYRDGRICMVNPLRSFVPGVKSVLTRFAHDLVPTTHLLDNDEKREVVRASPSKWVLKRSQGHGGDSVILPESASSAAWHEALEASRREVWIAQECLVVPKISMPVVEGGALAWSEKYFNWNPFVFGGRFAGSLVRVSATPLINITLGGGLLATYTT